MRRRWLLGGVAGVAVVTGAGLAIWSSRPGPTSSAATISSVTKAFAAKGISLEIDPAAGLAPGERGRALGVLWNQPHAAQQGVVQVIVLRSEAEARGVVQYSKRLDRSLTDTCGRTLAVDYSQFQSRNVFATFSSCDFTRTSTRVVARSVRSTVMAAMRDLAS
jgi:hypothetical protein